MTKADELLATLMCSGGFRLDQGTTWVSRPGNIAWTMGSRPFFSMAQVTREHAALIERGFRPTDVLVNGVGLHVLERSPMFGRCSEEPSQVGVILGMSVYLHHDSPEFAMLSKRASARERVGKLLEPDVIREACRVFDRNPGDKGLTRAQALYPSIKAVLEFAARRLDTDFSPTEDVAAVRHEDLELHRRLEDSDARASEAARPDPRDQHGSTLGFVATMGVNPGYACQEVPDSVMFERTMAEATRKAVEAWGRAMLNKHDASSPGHHADPCVSVSATVKAGWVTYPISIHGASPITEPIVEFRGESYPGSGNLARYRREVERVVEEVRLALGQTTARVSFFEGEGTYLK